MSPLRQCLHCSIFKVIPFSRILVLLLLLVCALRNHVSGHEGSSAVKYDSSSFEENVSLKAHFVMFFAPWCGHCKRLSPTWEELAVKFKSSSQKTEDVIIAKVDCTTDTSLCSEQDVTGYPTLKFFKPGTPPTRYRGKRDIESLEQFVQEQLGSEAISVTDEVSVEVPAAEHFLVELNEDTFHKHVETGFHFVKFYAPWCGHCQKLAPVWEALADSHKHDGSVSISKVDCTKSSGVCKEFEVKGYPTLLWFEDGKEITKYQGGRSHEDLKTFISKMVKPTQTADIVEDGRVPDLSTSTVVHLTHENFQTGISEGATFVKFYAPWCTHCKRLAPVWDELASKFIGLVNVKIAKVDCTRDGNKELCNANKVEGYPSLLLFRNGEKVGDYNGPRDLAALHEYVLSNSERDEL